MDDAELHQLIASGDRGGLLRKLAALSEKERKALAPGVRALTSSWPRREFDHTSVAIAVVGCLAGVRQVAANLRWVVPEAGSEPQVVQALRDRRPSWLADLPAALMSNELSKSSWRVVRAAVREGLVAAPEAPEYASAMPFGLMVPWSQREETSVYDRLLADAGLLDHEVWQMLTTELSGRALHDADKMLEQPWTPRGQPSRTADPERTWRYALTRLAAEDRIDRGRLLDTVIGAFFRDWAAVDTTWFVSMHDTLEPTLDEVRARQSVYRRLLAADLGRAVSLAQKQLGRLLDDCSLDVDGFLTASRAVVMRPDKGIVVAQLKLLDRLAKQHEASAPDVSDVVRLALEHERPDVTERAETMLRGLLTATVGAPAARATAPSERLATAAQPRPEPSDVTPVDSPVELAELFARLIEEATDPIDVERALEAVVRFGGDTPGHVREALLRRCVELLPTLGRFHGEEIRGDLAFICRIWLTGELVQGGAGQRITGYSVAANELRTNKQADWTLPTLVSHRTVEVAHAIRSGRRVLSLPSTDDGSIRASDLAARVRAVSRTGAFLPLDLGLAALRLPPGQYDEIELPGAHRTARQLRQHLNTLKRYQPDWQRAVGPSEGKWRYRNEAQRYVTWRDGRSGKGSETDLVAAVLDRRDPLPLMGLEVEDGEYAARFDQLVALWPLMLPHHRELLAAHAHPRFNRALTKNRSAVEPVLDGLARRTDVIGPVTASALVLALSAKNGAERTRAVDAVIDLAAAGLLDGSELGRQIVLLTEDEIIVGQRVAAGLGEAGRADIRAAHGVVDAIVPALPGLFGRRDDHRYVETLARAATEAARSVHLPPEYAALAEGKTKSVLAAACRQVPRA